MNSRAGKFGMGSILLCFFCDREGQEAVSVPAVWKDVRFWLCSESSEAFCHRCGSFC